MEEKKQSGKYIIVFVITAFLGLMIAAGLTFVIDPYFQYHMPWFGKEAYANNERYCNPGLAKNAEYDSVIVGSSMSENFNCNWFDEGYCVNTLKLTYSGCSAQDWVNAVIMAEERQNVKYVFGNIDMRVLEQEYGKERYKLPEYLYDKNYFNDVYYLLNKDVLFGETMNRLQYNYKGNQKNAYAWYDQQKGEYGHKYLMERRGYNGEIQNTTNKERIDDNTIRVVAQIKETILKYPDTTFEIFYSPYSILYFYDKAVNGEFEKLVEIYRYSIKELLECENCNIYFPAYNNIEMITDLDSYKDLEHYDIDIQYLIFEEMRDGVNMVTKENYTDIINWLRNTVMNYNYKELYEKYR